MWLMIVVDEYFAIQGIMDGVNWEVLQFEEVLTAGGYGQAVERLEKQPVEIILCDIEMPDESGLELIEWVNGRYPDTECIILSCHDEFDFARRAVGLKCLDYILKPVRFDFLTEVLARASRVVDYINAHLAEDLSVRSLANMVYVSPDHLTRSFKKRFSMTASDYILQKRMILAGELQSPREAIGVILP